MIETATLKSKSIYYYSFIWLNSCNSSAKAVVSQLVKLSKRMSYANNLKVNDMAWLGFVHKTNLQ